MSTQLKTRPVINQTASEILAWSREAIDSALRDAVAQLLASMRRIAGYHVGWWDSAGTPTNGSQSS